jgi:hypothetical protein
MVLLIVTTLRTWNITWIYNFRSKVHVHLWQSTSLNANNYDYSLLECGTFLLGGSKRWWMIHMQNTGTSLLNYTVSIRGDYNLDSAMTISNLTATWTISDALWAPEFILIQNSLLLAPILTNLIHYTLQPLTPSVMFCGWGECIKKMFLQLTYFLLSS